MSKTCGEMHLDLIRGVAELAETHVLEIRTTFKLPGCSQAMIHVTPWHGPEIDSVTEDCEQKKGVDKETNM